MALWYMLAANRDRSTPSPWRHYTNYIAGHDGDFSCRQAGPRFLSGHHDRKVIAAITLLSPLKRGEEKELYPPVARGNRRFAVNLGRDGPIFITAQDTALTHIVRWSRKLKTVLQYGSKAMVRFTFLVAAVVVLSIGGMIGYLLPLP